MGHTLCSSAVKLAAGMRTKVGRIKKFSLAKTQDFEIHHFIFGAVFLLFAFVSEQGAIGFSHCTLNLKFTTSGP
jgi:hypothetical protein